MIQAAKSPVDWPATMAAIRPLYEAWGGAVAAEIHGLNRHHLNLAARRYGVSYKGPKLGRYALDLPERVQLARAWLAAGAAGIPGNAQVNRPAGNAPGVIVPSQRPRGGVEVTLSPTVRITRAPAFVDRRWEPEPGYRREFGATAPGVDPLTMEAWR